MPLLVESLSEPKSVSRILHDTMLTSCAFLTALSFRELMIAVIDELSPYASKKKIVYLLFVAVFILLITIIIVVAWK